MSGPKEHDELNAALANLNESIRNAENALARIDAVVSEKHAAAIAAKESGKIVEYAGTEVDLELLGSVWKASGLLKSAYERIMVKLGQWNENSSRPTHFRPSSGDNSYEAKRETARSINLLLRMLNAAIPHPETGDPCIIYAIASYDKEGRFTLENMKTKKRSGSYKDIAELRPILFMHCPERHILLLPSKLPQPKNPSKRKDGKLKKRKPGTDSEQSN